MQRYMSSMKDANSVQAEPGQVLTNDVLRAAVPSLFATEAHDSRSARFSPIPTITILDALRREGFSPVMAQQAISRDASRRAFTKHMVRMRHASLANDAGEAFEVILVNANDGSAAYTLTPGFFRFVCGNGLIAGETFDTVKVRHSGNAMDDVIEGSYRVLNDAPPLVEQVRAFKAVELSREEQLVYANAAHMLRFPESWEEGSEKLAPVGADRLLDLRRRDDRGTSLWLTFNRVQENIIKGGQSSTIYDRNLVSGRRKVTSRAVGGIDQNRALNRSLWALTERMAALKAA